MNIFEYLRERKRLNILNKELNSCNSRISKIIDNIYHETGSYCIEVYTIQLKTETDYRDYLKEQLIQK